MNNSVFISYRRDVSGFMARAVFQDLRAHGYDVFMDIENIDSGQFDKIILNQIAARPYFVLILTPGTVERCADPGDWVRREIEHAMDLERVIVPLMTPNFSFSAAQEFLTGKLADLHRFNGVEVPHNYFEEAMERLRKRFLKPVDLPVKPTPKADRAAVQEKVEKADDESPVTPQQLGAQDFLERAFARAKDDFDGKLEDYTQAIAIDPQFADGYFNRGIVYVNKREPKKALADFTKSIELNPRHDRAYFERARVRSNIKDAIDDYTAAIRVNPLFATAYVSRGFDRRSNGDIEGMIADFEQALELQPDHPLAPLIADYVARYKEG